MKRRSKDASKRAKARRPNASKSKHDSASKQTTRTAPSVASEQGEITQLGRELNEAREQQTATAGVLRMISRYPSDVHAILEAIVRIAGKLCEAEYAILFRLRDGKYHVACSNNAAAEFVRYFAKNPIDVNKESLVGRTALARRAIHIEDCLADPEYKLHIAARLGRHRTMLGVPLLHEGVAIGVIGLLRTVVKPFAKAQIELVTSLPIKPSSELADQAVIAIENARLLNELRQRTTDLSERTADLTEALEQQTATSEVLQVISGSPGDLQPVFASMLENAVRICDARFGIIFRWEDDALLLVATHNTPPAFAEFRKRSPLRSHPQNAVGRAVATKKAVHVADLAAEQPYIEQRDLGYVAAVELGGVRTFLAVPMLKENELIGLFTLYRQEVRPFTDKQIALVTSFAAQAVIAIENARLLNELRQRTTDLSEALEQQTATTEVLQVISSSPGDLEPVFAAILNNAVRICAALNATLWSFENDKFHFLARYSEMLGSVSDPIQPGPNSGLGRVRSTKQIVHITDYASEPSYLERDPFAVRVVEELGIRTNLSVPMLQDNELVGAFSIYRTTVKPFTEKQIELIAGFAAQAVIAIENARLLNELRQSLEQQTATAQVLQVISSSTGDLAHVFATMLENATRICEAKFGTLYLKERDGFRATATHNAPPLYEEARAKVVHPSPHTTLWQAANTKQPVQIEDVTLERGYLEGEPFVVSAFTMGGYRSVLSVPMLHEDQVMGIITIFRQEVSSFSAEHISLLKNFAAQAVIAIENARLLNDLRDRTQQLQAQSEELADLNQQLEQRVADQVGEIERMSRLRRFLPPQVADLIVASGSEKQLESHRREITALFCDLRGFTGFTESADAEDVMALLRDYHAAIGEIIIKYNGTLERYAGDGVMVVFNDPVPVQNPALQAVLMALEVRDAIGALTETWRRWGHDIGFGIGIAHGFATLGTIGFEGRFDYAAIGTVSNVASRLCDEAKPGQILISPRVLTKVENAVKVEPVGEFELKGIRRPLAAYNVVAAVGSSG